MFSHIFSRTYSRFTPVVFFEADGVPAGGASPQSEDKPSNPTKAEIESVVQKTIQNVLNSQRVAGDTSAALEVLAAKALKEEKRAKDAEAKIGTIPEDVKAKLDAFEALGTVEDITKRLENATTLEAEKAQRELTDGFRKAAQVAGYDADALLEVIGQIPKSVIETIKKDGKDIQIAKVLSGDDDKDGKSFEESMKERFPKIHDSLKADNKHRVQAPVMGVGSGTSQVSQADAFIARIEKQKAEKRNPLMPVVDAK